MNGTYEQGYEAGFRDGRENREDQTSTEERALMDKWAHEYALALRGRVPLAESISDGWAYARRMTVERRKKCESGPLEEFRYDKALSVRARNGLHRLGCREVADIAALKTTTLAAERNCGEGTVEEVREYLAARGLTFADERDGDEQ